jgi:predicted metal-binding membrane protein
MRTDQHHAAETKRSDELLHWERTLALSFAAVFVALIAIVPRLLMVVAMMIPIVVPLAVSAARFRDDASRRQRYQAQ